MVDLAWVAPFATGAAGLVSAGVAWRVATNQQQQLRMALELREKVPELLRAEWDDMIYRTTSSIIRRSKKTYLPLYLLVGSWLFLVSGVVFDTLWLTAAGAVSALAGFIASWVKIRQVKRDSRDRIERIEAKIRHTQDLIDETRARQTEQAALIGPMTSELMAALFAEGMSKKELYAYLHGVQGAITSHGDLPPDPRGEKGMSTQWRIRARWRRWRERTFVLPGDIVFVPGFDPKATSEHVVGGDRQGDEPGD
ncbi:hypothetical protein [Sanguibacter sp. Leaf3]|uniref:hypothetical protein n=1 Tax=Sanguibacter sp. Leaf3 TaxID=1736209 RepID=UPI0006FF0E41|nr:hypothetical protein [Sanguibacter sp. Leaf3]KQT98372.1 hypothetical protein ASG53_11975 [Sanguibacter sp. Leaf3]